MYRILSIKRDGIERTDGRYPLRTGSVGELYSLSIGRPMLFQYLQDANGAEKSGYLYTSSVQGFSRKSNLITVVTRNSTYTLQEINEEGEAENEA